MTLVSDVTVAVDIGNTAAKWAVGGHTADQLAALSRIRLRTADWPEQIIRSVNDAAPGATIRWRIAAVNAPARDQLVEQLSKCGQSADVMVITCRQVAMLTRLPCPERLGIDRLLAAWQATNIYPGKRVIVVDIGSAITIDCASPEGEFHGGVIIPGLSLQFDSLARGTDALPALQPPESAEPSTVALPIPATDTVAAIRSGIMLGTAAAIDGLVRHTHAGHPHQLILTGGDAPRMSPLLDHAHVVLERLVIDAILGQS